MSSKNMTISPFPGFPWGPRFGTQMNSGIQLLHIELSLILETLMSVEFDSVRLTLL